MKRTIALVLIVILFSVMFCSIAVCDTKVSRICLGPKGASLRDSPKGTKLNGIHGNTWLDVYDQQNDWYLVSYNGQNGWVSDQQVAQKEYKSTPKPTSNPNPRRNNQSDNVPYIEPRVYGLNQQDWSVFWVQTQLKATGKWYQGSQWKVTGNVGKHTMSEITSFMNYMGNSHHTGVVDQSVIDALCDYLGDDIVYVDPNAIYKPNPGKTGGNQISGDTMTCECGGIMTETIHSDGYRYDDEMHWESLWAEYTCQKCGKQRFSDGSGDASPHTPDKYNICTVCGYDCGD